MTVLRHPVLWIVLVLIALTALWHAIGAPISLITQIAIYMLYGAGVNLLVGYTGLGPFGGLGDPEESRLQGNGGLRQDARGRAQATASPAAARPSCSCCSPRPSYA